MKIAVLYQKNSPPVIKGIKKPMKEGGYSDSGADIAFELKNNGYNVILPVEDPHEQRDIDWVFGDNSHGIEHAIRKGADTLWLNTVLYDGHPIEKYLHTNLKIIGPRPHDIQLYDDKFYTNQLLLRHGLSVVNAVLIKTAEEYNDKYPCVLKPIRGRGSQGVSIIYDKDSLASNIKQLIESKIYGTEFMIEPFLTGDEITIAVFPSDKLHQSPYCLPPVMRFNHIDGIAPYNGTVAVTQNSKAVENMLDYSDIIDNCTEAYRLLDLKAPIRIDCRKDDNGRYYIFDVNMKPNMTLGSRSHRQDQDSLVMIAAEKAGLSRIELLQAFINTAWNLN